MHSTEAGSSSARPNGASELGFAKIRNTGGTVEVHRDALMSGGYGRTGDFTSDFSPVDADNGPWQVGEDGAAQAPPLLPGTTRATTKKVRCKFALKSPRCLNKQKKWKRKHRK